MQFFSKKLGFKSYDMINTKEQTILNSIKDTFEGENIYTQYSVLGYRIDLFFMNISLQLKSMNYDILTGILIMKLKDKKY